MALRDELQHHQLNNLAPFPWGLLSYTSARMNELQYRLALIDRGIDQFHTLQPARGAYVAAMRLIASLRSLWTFPHFRRMGSLGGCR